MQDAQALPPRRVEPPSAPPRDLMKHEDILRCVLRLPQALQAGRSSFADRERSNSNSQPQVPHSYS